MSRFYGAYRINSKRYVSTEDGAHVQTLLPCSEDKGIDNSRCLLIIPLRRARPWGDGLMPSPPAVGDAGEAGVDLFVAVEDKGEVGIAPLVEELTDVLLLLGSEGSP